MADRDDNVYKAKLAEQAERYDGLCKWIIAMDMYDKVAKEVAPKKEKLEKAEREYAQTLAILEEKKLEVVRLEKQLAQLNIKLQEANKKQSRLQKTADACNRKLDRSVILIEGFEDEKVQWSNQVASLELKNDCLSGDVLLTSAFISYLSPISSEFRYEIVDKWYNYLKERKIPVSENWDLTTALISTEVIPQGLPKEKFFFENSIIHEYSHKYSLMVDPHSLAKIWIQKTVDRNRLHVTKYASSMFIEDVKHCLTSGKILIIENVGKKISSTFNAILNQELTLEDGQYFISFEGERLKFNKNFQLIIITTLSSPNYKSEISNKIKMIDFSITNFALHKKLLSLVIKTENPLVSKQISIYKKKQLKNENLLEEYQEKILKTLSNAEADLLEDNKALKILDDTKNLYKSTNKEIYLPDKVVPTFEKLEENYMEFSNYACEIFFCIEEFCKINKNVKLSYKQFLSIFRKSILEAPLSSDPLRRINNITHCFTFTISRYVGRIVRPKEALNFLFHMSCRILLFKGLTSPEELQFFLKRIDARKELTLGQITKELKNLQEIYLQDTTAIKMVGLQQLKVFEGLPESVKGNETNWKAFLNHKNPENERIPDPWHQKLSDFQKFLLLQTLRPDRTKECMRKLVSNVLEEKYVVPFEIDLEELYAESFCLSPILFLTTNNSSPLVKIKSFAKRKKFHNKFHSVCIFDGDNTPAENLIQNGRMEGLWVCILNCHLSKTWRYNLEKICEGMTFENTHESFRLWLVSDLTFGLPWDLVEKCVRVVYHDTDSFKDNLLVSYKDFVDDLNLQEYQNYSQTIVRLLYRLICFHTSINWRSRFESIAWNNPFQFEDHNLRFALKFLPTIINTYVSKDAVEYLIGEITYCRQFLNKVDYEVAKTLFQEFMDLDANSLFLTPSKNDTHDYIAHIIDKIPSGEVPELVGYNEVTLRRKNIQESSFFTEYVSSMTESWNETVPYEELKEIIKKSCETIDVDIRSEPGKNVEQDMLEFVLKQEIQRYTKLKNYILKYLEVIDITLTNKSLLSLKLKEIVDDLIMNRIPKKFLKYSFVSNQNYSSFILNLRQRLLFVKEWGTKVLDSFWISAFFYPNAILTTHKLLYARKVQKDLGEFSNIYKIVNLSDGFKIYGLYLVNARFDKVGGCIRLLPENVYFDEMPCITIAPLLNIEEVSYSCPVYRTDKRNAKIKEGNLIFTINLDSDVPKSTLVKLGVALTCEKPN